MGRHTLAVICLAVGLALGAILPSASADTKRISDLRNLVSILNTHRTAILELSQDVRDLDTHLDTLVIDLNNDSGVNDTDYYSTGTTFAAAITTTSVTTAGR